MGFKSPARVAAELAAPLFALHGWTWGGWGKEHVPTVDDIEQEYDRLTEWLHESPTTREIATGRLRVIRGDDDNCTGDQYLLDLVEVNPYNGEAMF